MFLTKLLYGVAHNLVWFECTHSLIDYTGIGIDKRNTRVVRSSGSNSHWTGDADLVIVLNEKQKIVSSHQRHRSPKIVRKTLHWHYRNSMLN